MYFARSAVELAVSTTLVIFLVPRFFELFREEWIVDLLVDFLAATFDVFLPRLEEALAFLAVDFVVFFFCFAGDFLGLFFGATFFFTAFFLDDALGAGLLRLTAAFFFFLGAFFFLATIFPLTPRF